MGRRPKEVRKFPDLRKRFKKGDRVKMTYHFPGEEPKRYRGTVTKVDSDFMKVLWDEVNGKPMPSPRETHQWDYSVYEGGGPYSTPITKVK